MMRTVGTIRAWLWNYFARMTRGKLLVVLIMNVLVISIVGCEKDDLDIPEKWQHPSDR